MADLLALLSYREEPHDRKEQRQPKRPAPSASFRTGSRCRKGLGKRGRCSHAACDPPTHESSDESAGPREQLPPEWVHRSSVGRRPHPIDEKPTEGDHHGHDAHGEAVTDMLTVRMPSGNKATQRGAYKADRQCKRLEDRRGGIHREREEQGSRDEDELIYEYAEDDRSGSQAAQGLASFNATRAAAQQIGRSAARAQGGA